MAEGQGFRNPGTHRSPALELVLVPGAEYFTKRAPGRIGPQNVVMGCRGREHFVRVVGNG